MKLSKAGVISNIRYRESQLRRNEIEKEKLVKLLNEHKEELRQLEETENFCKGFIRWIIWIFAIVTFYASIKEWWEE